MPAALAAWRVRSFAISFQIWGHNVSTGIHCAVLDKNSYSRYSKTKLESNVFPNGAGKTLWICVFECIPGMLIDTLQIVCDHCKWCFILGQGSNGFQYMGQLIRIPPMCLRQALGHRWDSSGDGGARALFVEKQLKPPERVLCLLSHFKTPLVARRIFSTILNHTRNLLQAFVLFSMSESKYACNVRGIHIHSEGLHCSARS